MKIVGDVKNGFGITFPIGFLILLIVSYPLLFLWQGGDLTDVGFHALYYQNFFENLQNGQTNSLIFFTDFIGATWFKLFPGFGVIGLKFLYLVFFYPVVWLSFLILKRYSKNRALLLVGIFCGIAFSQRNTTFVFNYDIASLFFLFISSFFLLKGMESKGNLKLFASGILFGLAFLSRFPDIVFLLLLPIALFIKYTYLEKAKFGFKTLQKPLRIYALFILGFASALVGFYLVLRNFNLDHVYLQQFTQIDDQSSHSPLVLLKTYFNEVIVFTFHVFFITSVALTLSLFYKYSKIIGNWTLLILFSALLCVVAYYTYQGFSYASNLKYLVPAFCTLPLLFSIISKSRYSTVAMLMSVVALTQVAGTNTGLFYKMGDVFIVLLPLALLIIAERNIHVFNNISIYAKPILLFGVGLILFFSVYVRFGWIYHVDKGLDSRFKATHPIEHKLMKGIYTTEERAIYIEQLSSAIDNNIKRENSLFIYGHQPMFYYLTSNPPPIKKFWLVNNYVTLEELFLSLNESVRKTRKWPMIVDTKQNIMGEEGQAKLREFLSKNNYGIVVENQNFLIWNRNVNSND